MKNSAIKMAAVLLLPLLTHCKREVSPSSGREKLQDPTVGTNAAPVSSAGLYCTAPAEQTNYKVYKMCSDGTRIGDVMPYYDSASGKFYVYFLKNIWNDATNQRHPWYGFSTTDFNNYTELSAGELVSCSTQGCDQDFAIGTGSVVRSGSTYYGFYTGFNPNYPSACVTHKEGIMLATSTGLNAKYTRNSSFTTLYAPTGQGFDEQDNFRDPFVFRNAATSNYNMLVAARKNVNGVWKGVIARYISSNLLNWTYDGVLYDGDTDNFFMMETPEVFYMGSHYYLLFSDPDSKHVYYRIGNSAGGPWTKPLGPDRFEGTGIYSGKTAGDVYGDRYIFGWTNTLSGNTDAGQWTWGGNLVAHKIFPKPNGDLAAAIPHTVKNSMETNNLTVVKTSQWGNVTNTIPGTQSYRIISNADFDVANVIFNPITRNRYKISTTMNFNSSSKDFGFMIGACDGYNDFYSLRFVPSQNRFSFDKLNRSAITSTTVATSDVPLSLVSGTDYAVDIVIENSMVVVYINNEVAMSARIYKATNTNWGIFTDHSDVTFTNIQVKYP